MGTLLTAFRNSLIAKRDEVKNDEKGFTLIELLVVVLIIGILAAIAIPVFLGQQDSAKDGGVKSDLANAKVAVVAYFTDNPTGPTPTFDANATTGLADYGYVKSGNTTSITFSGTAPAKAGATFCIVGVSASTSTPSFNITDKTGALRGSTCGVDTP